MHGSACGRRRQAPVSRGFTLIEIVIVVLVILILLTLTLVVVGQTINGDRVRGASRQVQNYLAGARDRAIYAASRQEDDKDIPPAVGVRFFADPSFLILDDPATPAVDETRVRAFGSMVFIQENAPLQTWLQVADLGAPYGWAASQLGVDPDGTGPEQPEPIDTLDIRSVRSLIDRGLIDSQIEPGNPFVAGDTNLTRVYRLPVVFDDDQSKEPYFVKIVDKPASTGEGSMGGPDHTGDGAGDWMEIGLLSKPFLQGQSYAEPCRFRLLPSPLPSEEPRILPRNTVIEVESSFIAGTVLSRLLRSDGSFDILFNARGVVEGPLAAAGVIDLVVADGQDVERGFRVVREIPDPAGGPFPIPAPNGPFVDVDGSPGWDDSDGDGNFDERRGDIFIISVRTQTGSTMVSDLNPVTDASGYFVDPFKYAELGGEAK